MDKQENSICDWKKWRYLGVCLMMCLWTGCSETMDAPDPNGIGMFLNYNSDGIYDGAPQTVQWVIFAGETESNKKYVSSDKLDAVSGKIPIRGGRLLNDIYTVVNPDAELSAALTDVGTHAGSEMESLKLVKLMSRNLPADASDVKVQRYHCYPNVCVQNDGTITYGKGGNMNINAGVGISQSEYPMAKLHVEFAIPNEAAMTFGGEKLVIRSIQVKGPKYSYLLPGKKYDGSEYPVRDCAGLTPCDPAATSYNATCEMLIPEYLRASTGVQKAMLVIVADRYKNGSKLGSARYEMPIGNAIDAGTTNKDDYDINRNKVYKFVFKTISGSGTTVDDWVVNKQVGTWEELKIPTEVGELNGFFLETTDIENFRSFRLPRYVRFKSVGQGAVTVDVARDESGTQIVPNDFNMTVLWDGPDHKSGLLALKKGNWRTSSRFTAYIKLSANNINKVLKVETVPTQYAVKGFLSVQNWCSAMNYTLEAASLTSKEMTDDRLIRIYSQATGTGCADYFEGEESDPLTGKGCWRVATIREGLWYLRDRGLAEKSAWAYEMVDGSTTQSYLFKTSNSGLAGTTFPTLAGLAGWDLHDLTGWNQYYPGIPRKGGVASNQSVLCVLDDKLEKHYNIGVNAADNPVDVPYKQAQEICAGLGEGGHSDWRLPTAEESGYALLHGGTQGIPNNFDRGFYWLDGGVAAGVANPSGTATPPGGVANVRCVRKMW